MASKKVALVTGSGKRRIGAYVADALAARGYSLVIHYYTSATEAQDAVARYRSRGTEAISVQADLTDETAARMLTDHTLEHFGRIDVLVNCASIWQQKRLEEITAADVRRNFEANTLGTFI